jgi:diaminopimelate epimerase
VAAAPSTDAAVVSGTVFYKMNGSGNDFVMVDGRDTTADHWPAERIRAICDRRRGVGADGLVILAPSTPEAVRMTYWNSDGSRGAMCGNAALCCGWLATHLELVAPGEFCLLTDAGPVRVRSQQSSETAEINLPNFEIGHAFAEAGLSSGERWMTRLTVGVPHLVVRVEDLEGVDLAGRGRALRLNPALGPDGANVNFVSPVKDPEAPWRIRTYERGVEGETLACGTGTVAAAVALASRGEVRLPIVFRSRGGPELRVRADLAAGRASNVWLAGQGKLVFRGVWESPVVNFGSRL